MTDDDYDDVLLDAVRALSRLSDRQLLERLVRTLDRMESSMSAASEYMTAALQSLDTQMQNLQIRLAEEAAELQAAVDAAAAGQLDTDALVAAAAKVQATAELVNTLGQPSAVVDPEDPTEAPEVPVAPVVDNPENPDTPVDEG